MGFMGSRPEIQLNFSSKMISEASFAHFLKKQYPTSPAQSQSQSQSRSRSEFNWDRAVASGAAGFATFAAMHPLDVVRTRFQVNDGRLSSNIPTYKSIAHALVTIRRCEGFRGLYAGFFASILGSAVSSSLYLYFYEKKLSPVPQFLTAPDTKAEALACLCTNPIWVIKTRLQLQTPLHRTRPYAGIYDAFRTMMREEGWRALCKGLVPHLFVVVSNGAMQLIAFDELRRVLVEYRRKQRSYGSSYKGVLNPYEFALLGGCSAGVAMIMTNPFEVIASRLQQRPSMDGVPKYMGSWHVVKETARGTFLLEEFLSLLNLVSLNLANNYFNRIEEVSDSTTGGKSVEWFSS